MINTAYNILIGSRLTALKDTGANLKWQVQRQVRSIARKALQSTAKAIKESTLPHRIEEIPGAGLSLYTSVQIAFNTLAVSIREKAEKI